MRSQLSSFFLIIQSIPDAFGRCIPADMLNLQLSHWKRQTSAIPQTTLLERFDAAGIFLLAILWMVYLLVPIQFLKTIDASYLGGAHPVYYLFTIPPVAIIAPYAFLTRRNRPYAVILWWALPCILWGGILFSANYFWSVRAWLSWLFRGFAAGGVFLLLCSRRGQPQKVISWLYFAAIAAALIGLLELFAGFHLYPFVPPSIHVPIGTQGNRIPYTSCLVPFLPVALWKLRYGNLHRWLQAFSLIILAGLIIFSQVRSAWLGCLVSIPLYLLWTHQEDNKFALLSSLALASLALLCLSGPQSRRALIERVKDSSAHELAIRHRLESYKTSRCLENHWFFGVGYGQYPAECHRYYNGPTPGVITPDNQYLRWLEENGIVGFSALIGFCVIMAIRGTRALKKLRDSEERCFYKSLLCGLAGMAVTFAFFDGFYWGACNMTFWSFWGLFATCLNKKY